jgi:hypothetical protein
MNLNLVEFLSAISGDAAGQTLRRLLAALEMFVSPIPIKSAKNNNRIS